MKSLLLIYALSSFVIRPAQADESVACKAGPLAKCGLHRQMVNCNGIDGFVDSNLKKDGNGNIMFRPGKDKIYGPCGDRDLQTELETCKWVGRVPTGNFSEYANVKNQVEGPAFVYIETDKADCNLPNGTNYLNFKGPTKFCAGTIRCMDRSQPRMISCAATGDYSCPGASECDRHDEAKTYPGDWKSLGLVGAPILIGPDPRNTVCYSEFNDGGILSAASKLVNGKCAKVQQLNDDSCAHARTPTAQGTYPAEGKAAKVTDPNVPAVK